MLVVVGDEDSSEVVAKVECEPALEDELSRLMLCSINNVEEPQIMKLQAYHNKGN